MTFNDFLTVGREDILQHREHIRFKSIIPLKYLIDLWGQFPFLKICYIPDQHKSLVTSKTEMYQVIKHIPHSQLITLCDDD